MGGNFNGNFCSDMGGFGEIHGGFGIGQINEGLDCWAGQLVKSCA